MKQLIKDKLKKREKEQASQPPQQAPAPKGKKEPEVG
jgi:hypothetical protein